MIACSEVDLTENLVPKSDGKMTDARWPMAEESKEATILANFPFLGHWPSVISRRG